MVKSRLVWVVAIVVALLVARKLRQNPFVPRKKILPKNASVLITGCDSGFGNGSAVALARKGIKVFAACLTEAGKKDLEALNLPSLRPFIMDVTKLDDIKACAQMIEAESPHGLYSLVNNAGIQAGYMFHWTELEKMRAVLEVNLFALFAVTKCLLPSLIKGKGRVINIASIAGSVPLLGAAAYSSSKHGVLGFTSTIRAEFYPLGIDVITIVPGFMKTPLVSGAIAAIKKMWDMQPQDIKDMYGTAFYDEISNGFEKHIWMASKPVVVIDKIVEAVVSPQPKVEYYIGRDSFLAYVPNLLNWAYYWDISRTFGKEKA